MTDDGYKALACAKLDRALMDLALQPRVGKYEQVEFIKEQARQFIFERKWELLAWCDMAEVHPDDVMKSAKRILLKGLNIRAKIGETPRYLQMKKYRAKKRAKFTSIKQNRRGEYHENRSV